MIASTSVGRTVFLLRRLNTGVAIGAGCLLLLTIAVTLFDVVARRFGASLGGTDEISGYAMAIATAWGLSYALTELVHVRIDLIRARLTAAPRALMDILSIMTIAGVAVLVAVQGWSVLSKTLANNSRANTPLETPLWIPQSLWWSGWVWFAASALILSLVALTALLRRDYDSVAGAAGVDETMGEAGGESGGESAGEVSATPEAATGSQTNPKRASGTDAGIDPDRGADEGSGQ